MKQNDRYERMAIAQTVIEVKGIKALAKGIVDHLNSGTEKVELADHKKAGISLRRSSDTDVSDSMISKAITKTIRSMFKDSEMVEHLSDEYEVNYADNLLDSDFVQQVFDINRSGRIIYIDIDL